MSFQNLLLWISGPLFLLLGGFISWRYAKHKGQDSTKELSEDEKTRLKEIMDD
jgi:cytochrome c-type biogenesis protein CcmH/NrfF